MCQVTFIYLQDKLNFDKAMSKKRTYDIIIIGGGVSGISSAYHLLKSGFTGTIGLLEGMHQ